MPTQPTSADFNTREDLGLLYSEFDLAMNRNGFIGHRVLPILTRGQQAGKFPRIPIEELLVNLDTSRAPGGPYNRSKRSWEKDDYSTEEHGLEAALDDRTLKRYDDILDAEAMEGEVLENALLMDYERAVASLMFNETTFAGRTGSVGTAWSNPASTPITNVNTAINTVRLACGVKPNALIINDHVFRNLVNCTQIVDRVKYQGFVDARPATITQSALAAALNVDEVIVSEGIYNTAGPGIAASLADIWSNSYALVARVAKTNNPMERCVGRTFMWAEEGAVAGDRMAVIAETYYEENRRGNTIRRRTDWGLKTLQLECGYLFSSVT